MGWWRPIFVESHVIGLKDDKVCCMYISILEVYVAAESATIVARWVNFMILFYAERQQQPDFDKIESQTKVLHRTPKYSSVLHSTPE